MAKKVKSIILMITIFSLIFTWGCAKKPVDSDVKVDTDNKAAQEVSEPADGKDVELELWSWFGFGDALKQFERENKGIKIKEKIIDFGKCEEEYMKALTSGAGPDILIFDSSFFSQYTVNNVLQDLLQEPYSANKYQMDLLGWDSGYSVDKKQLLSLTISTAPYVTFYRADIMKENGFPSEPDEFGKFIESPENILKIAKKLKEKKQYMFQYPTDLTDIVGATLGYFNDNLNYVRFGDLFAKSLELAIEADKNGMELDVNFWGEDGKKAIEENKMAMFYAGSYAMDRLERIVPEQRGKWRVTKPPLGLAAWASDTRIAINGQSAHKEQAWKLLQYFVTYKYNLGAPNPSVVPGYIPIHKNPKNMTQKFPFFGNQVIYPLLQELAEDMIQYKLTPMDNKARDLYRNGVWYAAKHKANPKEAVEFMRKDIEASVAEEKKALIE